MADAGPEARVRGIATLRWAYREVLEWRFLAVSLCMLSGLVLVFSVVGPVGYEDRFGPLERLVYWSVGGALCWPLCHALSAAILYLTRQRPPRTIAAAAAGGALFFTVPCTAVMYTVASVFNPEAAAAVPLTKAYLNVAVLALGCSGVLHYIACRRVWIRHTSGGDDVRADPAVLGEARTMPDPPAVDPAHGGFFDRLPQKVGRDVVYLNVTGHYLTVVTTTGSCLALMRMSDAVDALGELGLRVHRSYWVAHRHVERIVRRGPRTLVRVTGAHEVPVSRSRVAYVRAAVRARQREAASV